MDGGLQKLSSFRGTWRRGYSNGISKGTLWRRPSLSMESPFGEPGR